MQSQITRNVETPRKGMAVASLVFGIISIPTLGLALVGGVAGLILGIVALRRANRNPAAYGGKGLAIGGIVTSAMSLLVAVMMLIVAAIAVPNLLKSAQVSRETSAVSIVSEIGQAQVLYSVTKGKGKFTDLGTLASQGMINPGLRDGEWGGYLFSTMPINVEGQPPMFDTSVRPVTSGSFGTGNRSFYSNETMVIWEAEGGVPPEASPKTRIPKSGRRLSE